jgi:cell division transport system permease protein
MGAQNRFIARAFEWHYFLGALIAASFGALAAGGAFAAAGGLDEFGLSRVSFLPPLGLQMVELPWLLTVPAAAALIAWVTARLSVLSALREYY